MINFQENLKRPNKSVIFSNSKLCVNIFFLSQNYYMASSVNGQLELAGSFSVISHPKGQDDTFFPAMDYPTPPSVSRKKITFFFNIINPLMAKLALSRWLDIIGLVLICLFMGFDSILVHKHAKYLANIQPS